MLSQHLFKAEWYTLSSVDIKLTPLSLSATLRKLPAPEPTFAKLLCLEIFVIDNATLMLLQVGTKVLGLLTAAVTE